MSRDSYPSSNHYTVARSMRSSLPTLPGFIFPNTIGGVLDPDNLADRVIRPSPKAHNLMWKGWQAYRRGLATRPKSSIS
jgi:hypothetical protein